MLIAFADCVLDLDRRELMRASTVVPTAPQVFDLLAYLARCHERVVSRDELVATIWAGRIVSESTLASHVNAVRKAVGDCGKEQRVIRTVARKGFRFVAGVREVGSLDAAEVVSAAPVLPAKPSIAVLPFVNLSGDPQQDYLADGVVEDIIAALSRHRWLFVVARNSSFTYKGRILDIKQVGRELGVRYVLEGSWRKSNDRVRITGQLIDATTGAHHWAGRAEGVLGDIFELQDRITESVIGAVAPELERAEIERARHKPTGSLDAYDHYLRGVAELHQASRETSERALAFFQQAIDADPEFASAYAMAAWCHAWRRANGWMTDGADAPEAVRLARRAVELDKGDAVALTRSGHVLGYLAGDIQAGIGLLDNALVLNPNLAAARYLGGYLRLWQGDTAAAIAHLGRAMLESPRPGAVPDAGRDGGGPPVRPAVRCGVDLGRGGAARFSGVLAGRGDFGGQPRPGGPHARCAARAGPCARARSGPVPVGGRRLVADPASGTSVDPAGGTGAGWFAAITAALAAPPPTVPARQADMVTPALH